MKKNKLLSQYMDHTGLVFVYEKDTYTISYINQNDFFEGQYKGFNLTSKRGINHFANGLLHENFEAAYKAMKSSAKNDD